MTTTIRVADVSMERVRSGPMSGAWRCSTIIDGHYVDKTFLYYTKREANRLFREYVNGGGR